MAIRLLENFAGVAESVNVPSSRFGELSGSNGISTGQVFSESGKKWLRFNSSTDSQFGLDLAGIISAGTSKIVIGFRLRRTTVAAVSLALVGMASARSHNFSFAANQQEIYVELILDRSGSSQYLVSSMYVDGKFVNSVNFSSAYLSNAQAGTGTLYIVAGNNTYITDLYVLEDTQDSTPCDRIGPQSIVTVDVEESANTGWNSTGLADALSRTYLGTDTGTRITGSPAGSELKLKPKASFTLPNARERVNGVMLRSVARYTSAADLETVVRRATRDSTKKTILGPGTSSTDTPNVLHASSSRDSAEYAPATALDQVEFSLKVAGR